MIFSWYVCNVNCRKHIVLKSSLTLIVATRFIRRFGRLLSGETLENWLETLGFRTFVGRVTRKSFPRRHANSSAGRCRFDVGVCSGAPTEGTVGRTANNPAHSLPDSIQLSVIRCHIVAYRLIPLFPRLGSIFFFCALSSSCQVSSDRDNLHRAACSPEQLNQILLVQVTWAVLGNFNIS